MPAGRRRCHGDAALGILDDAFTGRDWQGVTTVDGPADDWLCIQDEFVIIRARTVVDGPVSAVLVPALAVVAPEPCQPAADSDSNDDRVIGFVGRAHWSAAYWLVDQRLTEYREPRGECFSVFPARDQSTNVMIGSGSRVTSRAASL